MILSRVLSLVFPLILALELSCSMDTAKPENATFFTGADLSYTNEIEDCGVVFLENSQPKDPYRMFAENGCNMVRLRLWHSPSWYDTLNQGKRYSDLSDVRRSIQRAKTAGMVVLLNFQLSDIWADPQRQIVPAVWLPVVNNLPVLRDSVYNYIFQTLVGLNAQGLLPDMVQIGNEVNRPILLSPEDDSAGVPMDWARNAPLFIAGFKAVRDAEKNTGKTIQSALHIADPSKTPALLAAFGANGVTDFDVIGMSYYWAWHKPVTIAQTGNVIEQLRKQYPTKAVMILETGYIWTTDHNDNASNIISETHPDYAPASPDAQYRWLADLTAEVKRRGGAGVLYWEPSWVSSPCWTPWGQGSHQEHAAFFDFGNNVLPEGGMRWLREAK
ncbi:MAG: arabinogalactan endo-beta-1,4-galactanase [Saprospiraceae bacterium]